MMIKMIIAKWLRNGFFILMLSLLAACGDDYSVKFNPEDYPPATVDMQLIEVSDHVYYAGGAAGIATDNQGFISNAGVVITDEGVVVFDALGTPSLAVMLVNKIREVTDKPIVKVVTSHYHADHIYGLQIFKELGAEIIATQGALDYLNAENADKRLEERRGSLKPWVNDKTRLVPPDKMIVGVESFSMGGVNFILNAIGKAHSDGDLTMLVEPDRVLFSGDIIFENRVAFLGDANTKHWQETLEHMETSKLVALVPGHGPAAEQPNKAISQTLHYLSYLRKIMGVAVEEMTAFDEVYARTDWSDFKDMPAFKETNRRNAYQVYLSMEQEMLEGTN